MARARLLKPGFFKNEELAKLSAHHRLCFEGLWTLADREGRLEDRPERIRGELFPFEPNISAAHVDHMLDLLAASHFISRYVSKDRRRYIAVLAFLDHQTPHHREPPSRIPAPTSRQRKTRSRPMSEPRAEPQASLGLSPSDPVTGDPVPDPESVTGDPVLRRTERDATPTPTPTPTRKAFDHFYHRFEEWYHAKPALDRTKDGARMKRLLIEAEGLIAVQARIDAFFDRRADPFFANCRHTMDVFFSAGTQTKLIAFMSGPADLSETARYNLAATDEAERLILEHDARRTGTQHGPQR